MFFNLETFNFIDLKIQKLMSCLKDIFEKKMIQDYMVYHLLKIETKPL